MQLSHQLNKTKTNFPWQKGNQKSFKNHGYGTCILVKPAKNIFSADNTVKLLLVLQIHLHLCEKVKHPVNTNKLVAGLSMMYCM